MLKISSLLVLTPEYSGTNTSSDTWSNIFQSISDPALTGKLCRRIGTAIVAIWTLITRSVNWLQ